MDVVKLSISEQTNVVEISDDDIQCNETKKLLWTKQTFMEPTNCGDIKCITRNFGGTSKIWWKSIVQETLMEQARNGGKVWYKKLWWNKQDMVDKYGTKTLLEQARYGGKVWYNK
ncbi:hypothetical protein PoB_003959100 [Plakobranchus ocellatus]|uniref:Uncharacterized protein n=1 Tax=Plakobranchus ocellatus TaxID=259542 RepID=A0AAV4AXX0_9GAST|nr:hypothetical protein PoB_003959100 [Plakobranchus ocellatus]